VRKQIQVHQKYSTFLYQKPPKEMLKSPGKTLSGKGSEPVSDKLLVVIAISFGGEPLYLLALATTARILCLDSLKSIVA
jgi:hypothetical protein